MAGVTQPLTHRAANTVRRLKNKKAAHTVRPAPTPGPLILTLTFPIYFDDPIKRNHSSAPALSLVTRRAHLCGRIRLRTSLMNPHRLCTFHLTLVQLPAHAVCARCPRSGRKIGRWRQPERLSERPQGASCAEGSDRPFFQDADVGGCSFICFVSCLSGQEGNEDSNAAQSYRRKIEK